MLNKTMLTPFSAAEIKPLGWLKRQLRIQADGLAGNLDRVWPDISHSRWVSGDRDGWERVPYWLDGFIPVAYLLHDEDMISRAKHYIDGILAQQEEDGWICPCSKENRSKYDMWAFILITKVLTVYADSSQDDRVELVLTRALRCFAEHLEKYTLYDWGSARWFECLIPIIWLYERTNEDWLMDLVYRLEIQGIDYKKLFTDYRDQIPRRKWSYLTHVVNLAMCLKSDALISRIRGGDPDCFAENALEILLKYHGMAVGHFTGDECVAGNSPIQGTELCGVVEAMFSYETLLAVGGNPIWADRLERLAFNALPAAVSPDMWSHQYDQMTNQVECSRLPDDHVIFGTNGNEAHLFGLEPNFGCCTANFGQGWPKLALSAFMRTEEGLASTVLVPSEVVFIIKGVSVTCRLETDYPFRGNLRYTICTEKEVAFPFSIRIPEWACSAMVDGEYAKPGTFFELHKVWKDVTSVDVNLEFKCTLIPRPNDMFCLWRGPLLYSIPLGERWEKREYVRNGIERRFPYCDYEVFAENKWNYGFTDESFAVLEYNVAEQPFSPEQPAVKIATKLAEVSWDFEYGVCKAAPNTRKASDSPVDIQMVPYGCTSVRMTELPKVSLPKKF